MSGIAAAHGQYLNLMLGHVGIRLEFKCHNAIHVGQFNSSYVHNKLIISMHPCSRNFFCFFLTRSPRNFSFNENMKCYITVVWLLIQ